MFSYRPLHMDAPVLDDQLEQLCTDTFSLEDLPEAAHDDEDCCTIVFQ